MKTKVALPENPFRGTPAQRAHITMKLRRRFAESDWTGVSKLVAEWLELAWDEGQASAQDPKAGYTPSETKGVSKARADRFAFLDMEMDPEPRRKGR